MKSKKLTLIIVLFLIVFNQAASGKTSETKDKFCQLVHSFPKHESLNKRGFSIQFSDHRQLVVLGHIHASLMLKNRLGEAIVDQKSDNATFLLNLRKAIASGSDTLEHYKEELSFLRDKQSNSQFEFMALETPNSHLLTIYNYNNLFYQQIKEEFKRRGLPPSNVLKEVVLLYFGPINYVSQFDANPINFIIGVDNELAQKNQVHTMEKIGKISTELKQIMIGKAYNKQSNKLEKLRDEMYLYYYKRGRGFSPDYLNTMEHEYIPSQMHFFSSGVREKINTLLKEDLALAHEMVIRDYTMAESLNSINKSGVYFVGSEHLTNLPAFLIEQCHLSKENTTLKKPFNTGYNPDASHTGYHPVTPNKTGYIANTTSNSGYSAGTSTNSGYISPATHLSNR